MAYGGQRLQTESILCPLRPLPQGWIAIKLSPYTTLFYDLQEQYITHVDPRCPDAAPENGRLPRGWQLRLDDKRRVYFKCTNGNRRTWADPRWPDPNPERGMFPPRWGTRKDTMGRIFYVYHALDGTFRFTRRDPRQGILLNYNYVQSEFPLGLGVDIDQSDVLKTYYAAPIPPGWKLVFMDEGIPQILRDPTTLQEHCYFKSRGEGHYAAVLFYEECDLIYQNIYRMSPENPQQYFASSTLINGATGASGSQRHAQVRASGVELYPHLQDAGVPQSDANGGVQKVSPTSTNPLLKLQFIENKDFSLYAHDGRNDTIPKGDLHNLSWLVSNADDAAQSFMQLSPLAKWTHNILACSEWWRQMYPRAYMHCQKSLPAQGIQDLSPLIYRQISTEQVGYIYSPCLRRASPPPAVQPTFSSEIRVESGQSEANISDASYGVYPFTPPLPALHLTPNENPKGSILHSNSSKLLKPKEPYTRNPDEDWVVDVPDFTVWPVPTSPPVQVNPPVVYGGMIQVQARINRNRNGPWHLHHSPSDRAFIIDRPIPHPSNEIQDWLNGIPETQDKADHTSFASVDGNQNFNFLQSQARIHAWLDRIPEGQENGN